MNDMERVLLQFVVQNDLRRARDTAKMILRNSKTVKDQEFCRKMLAKIDEQEHKGLEIPYNLKNIIQTRCMAYDFDPNLYFLTEREKEVLDHIKKMYAVGERMEKIGIHYPNTVLLYGESGTGKTAFAQYVAEEMGLPFLYVSLTQMMDSLMGKSGQNLELVFNFISSIPCVAVIDEIDAVGSKRKEDGGVNGELKRILIATMENIDKLTNRTILIAATNRPDTLDEALMRRLRCKHEVSRLNIGESKKMIENYLRQVGLTYEGSIQAFLDREVSLRMTNGDNWLESAFTPAAILDCLHEKIADAFQNSDEESPVVVLNEKADHKRSGIVENTTRPDLSGEIVDRDAKAMMEQKEQFIPVAAIRPEKIGIEDQYKWKRSPMGSAYRSHSPIERMLAKYELKDFPCPCCSHQALRIKEDRSVYGDFPKFWVGCDDCGWDCPSGELQDYGEVFGEFRDWYAIWIMLGRPEDRIEEDLAGELK